MNDLNAAAQLAAVQQLDSTCAAASCRQVAWVRDVVHYAVGNAVPAQRRGRVDAERLASAGKLGAAPAGASTHVLKPPHDHLQPAHQCLHFHQVLFCW